MEAASEPQICTTIGIECWKALSWLLWKDSAPLWVASFPRQDVLNCIQVENLSWIQACVCPFLSALGSGRDMTSSFRFVHWLPQNDRAVTWNCELNPFSPKLLFVRVFYHSHRNETKAQICLQFKLEMQELTIIRPFHSVLYHQGHTSGLWF